MPAQSRLVRLHAMLAALWLGTGAQAMQDADSGRSENAPNPIEASQIEPGQIEAMQIEQRADERGGSAYLDTETTPAPAPRPSLMQTASEAAARGQSKGPASQITARGESGAVVPQLSKAELAATLAQLTPAERRVLLQAIEGSDICENPPEVPAIVALCQNRLESRSQEFAPAVERPLSAEERLLSTGLDSGSLPSLAQVIERLSRSSAASDDFNNQAIASIALATPPAVSRPEEEGQGEGDISSLSQEAQALINALINQLGGSAP